MIEFVAWFAEFYTAAVKLGASRSLATESAGQGWWERGFRPYRAARMAADGWFAREWWEHIDYCDRCQSRQGRIYEPGELLVRSVPDPLREWYHD